MKKIAMIILLTITGSFGIVSAQKPMLIISDKTGWHKMGETTVNFEKEKDEIIVLGANRFSSLFFKVNEAPINLVSMVVFYVSGDNEEIKINMPVKEPGDSKVIDLKAGERSIKKIEFVYKTLPNQKDLKAHVELWGLKTNTDQK